MVGTTQAPLQGEELGKKFEETAEAIRKLPGSAKIADDTKKDLYLTIFPSLFDSLNFLRFFYVFNLNLSASGMIDLRLHVLSSEKSIIPPPFTFLFE